MSRVARGRVLIVGLDMGDAALIEAWARAGVLPALQSVIKDGVSGRVGTTADVLHTSSWPTIFTGVFPGRHGVYYPYQPVPGQQHAQLVGPGQYGQPPFWQALDRAGRRCIVVDAPETFPVEGFGGVQIFEWTTWAWYWRRMTQPASLEKQLRRRFGAIPLRLEARKLGVAMPDVATLRAQLLASAAHKAALASWLMRSRDWDLCLVVFAEPHPAGHYLWPAHAPAPSGAATTIGHDQAELDDFRDVYVAVDAAIAELLKACDDDVTVLVVSGDGVGPNHTGCHLLPEVLTRGGFSVPVGRGNGDGASRRGLLRRVRDAVPAPLRASISARLPLRLRDRLVAQVALGALDWSTTRAVCLPTDLEGVIRVNLKGREPEGVVEPGAHYEDVCAALAETLEELSNPATGRPAVGKVWRIDRCFPGPRRNHLPDLSAVWRTEAPLHEVESGRLGRVTGTPLDPRTGTHHPVGFVAARGHRLRSGGIPHSSHIADVAPTVLTLLGVAPPSDLDGHAMEVASP